MTFLTACKKSCCDISAMTILEAPLGAVNYPGGANVSDLEATTAPVSLYPLTTTLQANAVVLCWLTCEVHCAGQK